MLSTLVGEASYCDGLGTRRLLGVVCGCRANGGRDIIVAKVSFRASVTAHVMSMSVPTIAMVESTTIAGARTAMMCECLQQVLLVKVAAGGQI